MVNPEVDGFEPYAGDDEVLELADADGTVARLTQDVNARFRRATRGTTAIEVALPGNDFCLVRAVLEITLTADVEVLASGAVAGLQYPATIVAAAEIESLDEEQYVPRDDPDGVVDVEMGPEPD